MNSKFVLIFTLFTNSIFSQNIENSCKEALNKYLKATSWITRAALVLHPENTKPKMEKAYKDIVLNGKRYNEVDIDSTFHFDIDNSYRGYISWAEKDNTDDGCYYFEVNNGVCKIDWEASVGYNDFSFSTFKALKPNESTNEFRIEIQITPLNPFQNEGYEMHYKCLLESKGTKEFAYFSKDSPFCKNLLNILTDGYSHKVIAKLKYENVVKSELFDKPELIITDVIKYDTWVK